MEQFKQTTQELCDFISGAPSCFHAVSVVECLLREAGFQALSENCVWNLTPGGSYYVTRNGSSLAAFTLPEGEAYNYQIISSHCDSPTFKIKESPEITKAGAYIELNVEKYGGPLFAPWFDRPLGIAGRMILDENGTMKSVLADTGRAVAMIPSLAIHMNRSANENLSLHVQSDMLPIFGGLSSAGSFASLMAQTVGADPEKVLGADLFLYDRSAPVFWGANEEFFSSPRLDDLQNVFASTKALIANAKKKSPKDKEQPISMSCIFDNEEVGSTTKQGADSTFLQDVLKRIRLSLAFSEEQQQLFLSRSFLLSTDNAHAVHPNFPEKADPVNRPVLNGGVVLKHSAAQKYTTDAVSAAIFRGLCKKAGVPVQEFTNHSDIPGGSTLGNIATAHVSMVSADIGCPQLAMHSPYETSGTKDTLYMIEAMEAFYGTQICRVSDTEYALR